MYASKLATVHILFLLLALSAGCNSGRHSSVPVPINVQPPYSYSGRIGRIWGGDNFEVVDHGKLHYAFVRGIDAPEPGQPFHDESKALLRSLSRHGNTTVNVFDRDDWQREVCEVRTSDPNSDEVTDPAYELLLRGLAWFDRSDGPYAVQYKNAEALAREKKIGIWSQENPIPPWEFWESQVGQLREPAETVP